MKKVLLICSLISGTVMAHAQYESNYNTLESPNKGEVIYKGSCTFEDIAKVPAFDLHAQSKKYKATGNSVAYLKQNLKEYNLIIFLGTWCEDSHRLIPQLYSVLESVEYPFSLLTIHALDRDKKGLNDVEKKYNITNVPTIIVMQKDGTEKGRITETVQQNIEADLEAIIKK